MVDIIWIVVDGIRPDKLRSCGNLDMPYLFLDEILLKGTLFTKVIAAGANTKTSIHAAFTSIHPSSNKMNAFNYKLLTKLDPLAVSIIDILKKGGYKTHRYQDIVNWKGIFDMAQYIPTSGFDVWKSSGYAGIVNTPNYSFTIPERDAFIENFNKCPSPKFAYIHLFSSHDLNVEDMYDEVEKRGWYCLTSEAYEKNMLKVSADFKDVWNKLQITDETLVIVCTDHGARLDDDLYNDELKNGVRLLDINMNTFCSFIGPNIPKQIINRMVRLIDVAPTILELTNCEPLLGQGTSLSPLIFGEEFPEIYAFMEAGGIYDKPPAYDESNIWGVRTEKWKYWKHAWRGEWLIDLENDPNEQINLIGKGFLIEDNLRKLVEENLINNPKTAEQLYLENSKARGISTYLTKQQIIPEISLYILIRDKNTQLKDIIFSILNQFCVYFELIICDSTSDGKLKPIFDEYQDYRLFYKRVHPNEPLSTLLRQARGEFCSLLSTDLIYKLNFLYELRKILRDRPEISLVYSNYRIIDQTNYENIIKTDKIFSKTKNVCYCFLIRKDCIKNLSNFRIFLFNNKEVFIPLAKNSLITHSSEELGFYHYKSGFGFLILHNIYFVLQRMDHNFHKLVSLRRRRGWLILLNRCIQFFEEILRSFMKLGDIKKSLKRILFG